MTDVRLTPFTRGSNAKIMLDLCDSDDNALPLSDYEIDIFEPHPMLVDQLTVTWEDAAVGRARLRFIWAADMPTGDYMSFRLRWSLGDDVQVTPRIRLVIQ